MKRFKKLKQFLEKIYYLSIPMAMWILLTAERGNTIRGRKKVDNTGLSLEAFKFSQPKKAHAPITTQSYVIMGLVALTIVGTIVAMIIIKKRRIREHIHRANVEKATLQLDVAMKHLEIPPIGRQLLEDIANSKKPEVVIPLVQNSEDFEAKVDAFKQKKPDPKSVKRIYKLRQMLGYDFNNRRIPFTLTQMLNSELKLECQIPHPKRQILFISPILNVTETQLWIKPPTIKGKAANLKKFPHLICKIRRGEEADYEFQAPIQNQIAGKLDAVVLGHSQEIKKLFIRESERIQTSIATTFFVVSDEQLSTGQQQGVSKEEMSETVIEGHIEDMSAGGFQIGAKVVPEDVNDGDIFVFHLPGANMREDLMAKVLKIIQRPTDFTVHLQFIRMRELSRMKINKYLFNMKKRQGAASPSSSSSSALAKAEGSAPASKPAVSAQTSSATAAPKSSVAAVVKSNASAVRTAVVKKTATAQGKPSSFQARARTMVHSRMKDSKPVNKQERAALLQNRS